MATIWKERFDPAAFPNAVDAKGKPLNKYFDPRIRDFEDAPFQIPPNTEWVYYVRVCDFTFIFYSLPMIQEYLDYYSKKVVPSRRKKILWADHSYEQNQWTRLPLYLREEPKRRKVVKALTQALHAFGSGDRGVRTYDRRQRH